MNLAKLNDIAAATKEKCKNKKRVCVCAGAACISSGAIQTLDSMKKIVKEKGLDKTVDVIPVGCIGACHQGPLVKILPDETIYQKITPAEAALIAEKHLAKNEVVKSLLFATGAGKESPVNSNETDFFKKQRKVVLETCGNINPESIEDYIAVGGYQALYNILSTLSQEEVIAEVKAGGLRGRGGAGFPTGLKWEMVHRYINSTKYVVCNGDEGDPGAFMDRSVLEGDPHRILEGMAIAGYAVGAQKGYIYVRAEYPLAIKRLETAIKQARVQGLLGDKIFETDFNFDIEIRIGAGAFVCGEETALLASIEGKRGTPRPRPPYPAESGLWGKPTLINNVETFANIPKLILIGGKEFASVGTQKSAGTKVFALAGKIMNTGLVEVPMGITLREIIFEIGGGIPGGKKFKAAQTGGPSGGCIPESHLDTPVDYESLGALGTIMGSGGMIIMDETSCMVDVARYFMDFCMNESCGKCVPCRVGTKQMFDLLNKICTGQGSPADLALLEELAPYVRETSLCGLGMTAPNPLMSTLRYFREEYMAHINDHWCPAGVCKMEPAAQLAEAHS